jgi:aminoglycoside phosphotransferase (APT) family kinase protein
MHDNEVDTDADLVRRLLEQQHPRWRDLAIERVPSAGTDNAIYRLGDELAVRLPRIDWAVENVAKEQTWLPRLAPHLPLAVPLPVAAGEATDEFPYPWGVVQWLPGEMASLDRLDDPIQAALDLAAFVRALQACDSTGGPTNRRGQPIRHCDEMMRDNIAQLDGEFDVAALTEAWERVLAAPDHDGPPVWIHGDLAYLNLLACDGQLSAVIDWGTCCVGDPAGETVIGWSLFGPDARAAYRDALGLDDAAWERGKGWVLLGVGGVLYYRDTNPVLADEKRGAINVLLAEQA